MELYCYFTREVVLFLVDKPKTMSLNSEVITVRLETRQRQQTDSSSLDGLQTYQEIITKDSDEGGEIPQTRKGTVTMLVVLVIGLIAARSFDRALYYRIAYEMDKYSWFLSAIVLPLGFIVIVWPIVWYKLLFTNTIPKNTRVWGTHKTFMVLASFDAL